MRPPISVVSQLADLRDLAQLCRAIAKEPRLLKWVRKRCPPLLLEFVRSADLGYTPDVAEAGVSAADDLIGYLLQFGKYDYAAELLDVVNTKIERYLETVDPTGFPAITMLCQRVSSIQFVSGTCRPALEAKVKVRSALMKHFGRLDSVFALHKRNQEGAEARPLGVDGL